MWESFVDQLILRVNFGIYQTRTPALVILCNKLNFPCDELTIPPHRITKRIPLLVIAILIDMMVIAVIGALLQS
ncbi:hypothetical protein BHE73_05760 [Klebsiella pneumoniae]|nr:hypothetical protein BHE73_05760 [Klebsiella pneumoniae]